MTETILNKNSINENFPIKQNYYCLNPYFKSSTNYICFQQVCSNCFDKFTNNTRKNGFIEKSDSPKTLRPGQIYTRNLYGVKQILFEFPFEKSGLVKK